MSETIRYEDRPWLKNYAPQVPTHIDYKEICIPTMLETSAKYFPHNVALICMDYMMTYTELKYEVDCFASCLANLGIKKGDKISILLPNCISLVVAYYAVLKIGAIAVMNNPLYSDRELKYQYNDSQSKALICLDQLTDRMISLRPETGIKHIIYTAITDYSLIETPKSNVNIKDAPDLYKLTDCIAKYEAIQPEVEVQWEDTAVLQYTGGTTGLSKAAVLTHRNLSTMVQRYAAWFHDSVNGEETMLSASPFFHILGMQVGMNWTIYAGWKNVIIPKPQTAFLLEAIRKYRPTFSPLIPTHYIGMLQHPDLAKTDLTCFKGLSSGGASLPVDILHRFEKVSHAAICEGFGMSETSPQTHLNPYRGGGPRKAGSIGVPWIDTEVRIVDIETGEKDMPVGDAGEMLIRGPQVTKEYYNKPEETKESITTDGWLHTGDIAYMDEDGYFYIVDRKKDLIISSGYNIYPRELEEILYQNPKVNKVAVIGIPDDKRGENIGVFISLKKDINASTEEFMEYCTPKLAKYKWPSYIEIRDSLPESNVGKLLKNELRKEFLKEMSL